MDNPNVEGSPPSGQLRVDTQAPDGNIAPMSDEFKVMDAPSRLVMTNSPVDLNGHKLFEIQHTITLTEEEGLTTLEIISAVLSAGLNAD